MKSKLSIACPHCRKPIIVADAVAQDIQQEFKRKFSDEAEANFAAEREKIRQEMIEHFSEEQQLKISEKEKIIADLRATIELLQRKANQGSQQVQGEVLEENLANTLSKTFPQDKVTRVAKGKNGGDVIHTVVDSLGNDCGRLLWESKNTATWSDKWLLKVKEDALRCKATLAVIVSRTLPKEIQYFGRIDNVWVTSETCYPSVALVLRSQIIQIAAARPHPDAQPSTIFGYLAGPEFSHRIELIVTTVASMKMQLDRERQAFAKTWAEREKSIARVAANLSEMYGELKGLTGPVLPELPSLTLSTGADVHLPELHKIGQ